MYTSHGDLARADRLRVYSLLVVRFGFDRVLRHAPWIGKAITAREARS